MITRTQYKLAEAEFFFGHLERSSRHVPDIDFFLSAFISANRSVLWIMRAEFLRVRGWESWYQAREFDATPVERLAKLNKLRTNLMKTVPVKTRTTATVSVSPENFTPENWALMQEDALVHLSPRPPDNRIVDIIHNGAVIGYGTLKRAEHSLPEFPEENAEDVCRLYLSDLRSLVGECHRLFGRGLNDLARNSSEERQ